MVGHQRGRPGLIRQDRGGDDTWSAKSIRRRSYTSPGEESMSHGFTMMLALVAHRQ